MPESKGDLFSFRATEGFFLYQNGVEFTSDWCWFKLVLGSCWLLSQWSKDLSLAVGHVSEYPHSGTRYFIVDKVIDENIIINCQDYSLTASRFLVRPSECDYLAEGLV